MQLLSEGTVARELRVMHACEKGAVGVYRGHKCVARYFFRTRLEDLDSMRFHEREHSYIFARLLAERGWRQCYFSGLWFWGGLFYGVLVGMLGLKAIGTSTAVIERIVDHEFELALSRLTDEPEICQIIRQVQIEEREHRTRGELLAGDVVSKNSVAGRVARLGAYTAMHLAKSL